MGSTGAAFCLLLMAGQEPAAPTGPVAYWRFDETAAGPAANRVAGAPAGAPQGNPTISPLVAPLSYNGDINATPRSLIFDGADDVVSVANFGAFTRVTVSAWIYRTGAGAGRESIVSYKEGNGVNMGFVLCLNESGGTQRPRFFVQVNGTWQNAEEAFTLPTGEWTHLAGVYDGAQIRLYRAGTQVASFAAAGNMTNTGSQTTGIGSRASLDQHRFPGHIDDVRIYERALAPEEIAVLAAGAPAPVLNSAVPGVGQVDLAWTAPAGAVTYAYRVKRGAAGSGVFAAIATVSGTSYTDATAVAGTPYDYVVTAVSAAESGHSGVLSATALLPPPRVNDHEEGLFGENCACGSTARGAGAGLPLLALAALILSAARRR